MCDDESKEELQFAKQSSRSKLFKDSRFLQTQSLLNNNSSSSSSEKNNENGGRGGHEEEESATPSSSLSSSPSLGPLSSSSSLQLLTLNNLAAANTNAATSELQQGIDYFPAEIELVDIPYAPTTITANPSDTMNTRTQQQQQFSDIISPQTQLLSDMNSPQTQLLSGIIGSQAQPQSYDAMLTRTTKLSDLSSDELFYVYQYLPKRDMLRASASCKKMYESSMRNYLWKSIVELEKNSIEYQVRNIKPYMQLQSDPLKVEEATTAGTGVTSIRKKYIELKKKIQYAKNVKRLMESRRKMTFRARFNIRDRICPLFFGFFLFVTSLVIIATCVLAPLWFDGTIPNNSEQPWWFLIPYAPFAFLFLPCLAILLMLFFSAQGWFPGITCLYTKIRRFIPHECICNFICGESPYGDRECQLINMGVVYSVWLPVLILVIGLKLVAFRQFLVWRFIFIPVYTCWGWALLDASARFLMNLQRLPAKHSLTIAFLIFNVALVLAGISLTIGMSTSKADGVPWMEGIPYSVTLVGAYIAMAIFMCNVSFSPAYYELFMDTSCQLRFALCMAGVILPIVLLAFSPLIVFFVFLPLKLDRVFGFNWIWVFSPLYIGFFAVEIIAGLAFLCYYRRTMWR